MQRRSGRKSTNHQTFKTIEGVLSLLLYKNPKEHNMSLIANAAYGNNASFLSCVFGEEENKVIQEQYL